MLLPDLKTPLMWALGLGLVAALATAGIERTRAAGARADAATARKDLADYRATAEESGRLAERAARDTENMWRSRVDGVIQDGQKQIAAARADADGAAAARDRLRDQLSAYIAAVRRASQDSEASNGGKGQPGADPLDLLAQLYGRADEAAGAIGQYADQLAIAGGVCERISDRLQPAAQ